MNSFSILSREQAEPLSREQLISMYNEAVETIWFLEFRIHQLSEENDSLWESYEDLADRHFG